MKEATGELNMTVITVIAIGAIAALFYAFVWPMIQRSIVQQTCNAYGADASGNNYQAVKSTNKGGTTGTNGANEKNYTWYCCPKGTSSYDAIIHYSFTIPFHIFNTNHINIIRNW